jgi:hypothetical protein
VSERNRRDRYLLVVTEDGFAKRLPVAELPPRRRAAKGVCVSSVPLAAALEVGAGDEVVLASALGKVERVAVTEVPLRRRRVLSAGQMSKGVRVMRLPAGARVADEPVDVAAGVAQSPAPGFQRQIRVALSVALSAGESVAQVVIPARSGRTSPMLPREQWAATEVHAAGRYWCGSCGAEQPDPHAVYGCLDRHAAVAR